MIQFVVGRVGSSDAFAYEIGGARKKNFYITLIWSYSSRIHIFLLFLPWDTGQSFIGPWSTRKIFTYRFVLLYGELGTTFKKVRTSPQFFLFLFMVAPWKKIGKMWRNMQHLHIRNWCHHVKNYFFTHPWGGLRECRHVFTGTRLSFCYWCWPGGIFSMGIDETSCRLSTFSVARQVLG